MSDTPEFVDAEQLVATAEYIVKEGWGINPETDLDPFHHRLVAYFMISLLVGSLRHQGADGWLTESLTAFLNALEELNAGQSPEIFRPYQKTSGGRPSFPFYHGVARGFAAAAVSLAMRGEKERTRRSAAKCLAIPATQLENFRRNIMKGVEGPIKSYYAHIAYTGAMRGDPFFWIFAKPGVVLSEDGRRKPSAEEVLDCLQRVAKDWRV